MPKRKDPADFQAQFSHALTLRLGNDWAELSDAEILRRTRIEISRETLRKIRAGGYAPSPRVQSAIFAKLTAPSGETAMQYVESDVAREEVRALLGTNVTEVPAGSNDPRLQCDLVLEDKALGLLSYIVRCLDDADGELTVDSRYFTGVIENLSATMRRFHVPQGVIITHRRVPPDSREQAARASINLRNYDEFVESRLGTQKLRDTIEKKRAERDLTDISFTSLPAQLVVPRPGATQDSIGTLKEHFAASAGSAIAAVLGSFGRGKTSTLLTLAHMLAQGDLSQEWALPLWIDGATLTGNLDETLQAAAAKLSPEAPLPIASIKKLISRGRLWVFVDALDEALALRNRDDLKLLVSKFAALTRPNGRLIFSARQEMFDSVTQELSLFDEGPRGSDVENTLVLRLQKMPDGAWKNPIRARLPAESAARAIALIESDPILVELVSRPIFMHIAAQVSTTMIADASGSGMASLFDAYVKQWSYREKVFGGESRMPMEDRMLACELLALYHMVIGHRPEGYSVEDLRNFASSQFASRLDVKDLDQFVYEARIAMFLERRGDDHFEFAHASMREFFLARRAASEIRDAALKFTDPAEADLAPYVCKTLGRVPFGRSMGLVGSFTIDLCAKNRPDARRTIEAILVRAKDWRGHRQPGNLQSEEAVESPPFGPGRYRFLIPNLSRLLQEIVTPEGVARIDLSGADLSLADLSDALVPAKPCIAILTNANLSQARLPPFSGKEFEGIQALTDGALVDASAHEYCTKHGLFAPSRFNEHSQREFVLIPGGSYQVVSSETGKLVTVKVAPYLMQRYPVTNRQFKEFLAEYPAWRPGHVRQTTQNDYYLGYWPLDELSERFKDDGWLDRPVVQVSWKAAAAYASAAGMRLPTEVEWEIAASRGSTVPGAPRPWGDSLHYQDKKTIISPAEDERQDPAKGDRVPTISVLRERANVPGFVEWHSSLSEDVPSYMIGLVREWVMDIWRPTFPAVDPISGLDAPVNLVTQIDSIQPGFAMAGNVLAAARVLRGGGFNSTDDQLTAQYRAPHRALNVNPDVGFRCVRPIALSAAAAF